MRGNKERNLTVKGDTKRSPSMMSLITATVMKRWKMEGEDPKLIAWEMLDDENLPFLERVRAYAIPYKFKLPHVRKYDGSGDPNVYLATFQEHLILHGTPDKIVGRAFPLTLTGVAKDWFIKLPPKLVNNFKELGYLFLAQFLVTQKRKRNITCLLTMR